MAEQHKESSSADSKEKSSLLDDKNGKEFLSSWKSMSMADDDAMDFSFDTVPKGRKKTFDFDKLDMKFNLDDDFGKISSFKVDMSDLDFTCPPKNSSQSKDKKGESSGTKAGKQDGFNFSFDFNELDSFNLDSSSTNGDTNSNSNLRKKGVSTEGSDSEGPKKPKINDDESGHASNNSMAMKPPVSEKLETSKVDNVVGNLGNVASGQGGFASKFLSSGNLDMPIEIQTSGISKTIRANEMDEERDLPEKIKSAESKPEQVITKAPSQPACQSDSGQDTIPEQHKKMFSSGTKVINVSGDKEKATDKATCVDSEGVDLQSEQPSLVLVTKSDSSVGEATNLGSSAEEVTNDPHKKNNDISFENISKNAFKKISCDNDVTENKKPALECHLASETSKPVVDRMMLMKDNELQGMQPNISRRPEEKCFLKHLSSTAGTKVISFSSQKSCDMSPRSISQARESYRSKDTQIGSKSVRDSLRGSDKLNRDGLALNHSTDDLKSCSNSRESIVSDLMPSASKLAGNMQSFHEEVLKSKAMLLETGKSTKEVNMLSSQVNPSCLTEKTAKNTTQVSVKPKAEVLGKESSQKPRITSIEGNKISSFKTGKITHALSSLKALRNVGANMVLAAPLYQKEAISKVKSGQNMEIQSPTASKNDHLTSSGDNQKPQMPFLKRKATEVSEVDLTSLRSLKRLSQSPNNNRNSKKSSEEVVEQVESKPHNMIYNHPTLGLESPSDIKVMDVEISDSVLMEDNSNVEKAEAYMKELEDICIMLKKKHEEAKELLVRAIVNNNNLLMLNHPIYEEKIWKVQKFASELMSKGIQP
ncbi:PREDICTED: uncharacterized protein At4g18490 isoform X1 [Lupinus angustifolius]|uniref:uncharacterized protein At4g18490 isoform X1 n=1 Tax=Lupinus angustifolius TaxID=3871 RepID=UPI00092EE7EF|nr:PREDICTED: uncharacterized protein At4g18490 isoform X1 [Lupinus angustifolius]